MLGGKISNADEDEVEDELEALEAEVTGMPMPDVPTKELPKQELSTKERAKARERQREEERDRVPNEAMLA